LTVTVAFTDVQDGVLTEVEKLVTFGAAFIVKLAELPINTGVLQPATLRILVTVTVVVPEVSKPAPGIMKVPVLDAIVIEAVCAVAELLPVRLYVTVYVPAAREVELTVTVTLADGQVEPLMSAEKDEIFGLAFIVILAVLPEDNVEVQLLAFLIPVMVTVVVPMVSKPAPGTVKVPVLDAIVIDAVCEVALLVPVRLYVTVYVPAAKDVELTVTVAALVAQTALPTEVEKLEIFGLAFIVMLAVLLVDTVVLQPAAFLIPVMVTVVVPDVSKPAPGTVKVPVLDAMVIEAVWAAALLVPVRL
jgi:hypothetical protein